MQPGTYNAVPVPTSTTRLDVARPSLPNPTTIRRSSIDIGTNSVKVLVADVHGTQIDPVWEFGEQTRLGRGFYETHRLQPGAIKLTAETVARFVKEAQGLGATSVRALATSAARDAVNADDLRQAVRDLAGIEIEIISGTAEAELSFAGLRSRNTITGPVLALDVGGGSTEFMLGGPDGLAFRQSIALGSVRLHEKFQPPSTPSRDDLATVRRWIGDQLQTAAHDTLAEKIRNQNPTLAIGVGGTTAILALISHRHADFDTGLIESTVFTRETLTELVEMLWSMPLAARQELPGLPPNRADVILFGSAIYEAVLAAFQIPTLGISMRGLRYGALVE